MPVAWFLFAIFSHCLFYLAVSLLLLCMHTYSRKKQKQRKKVKE
jgi:hypothetical protein